MIFRDTEDDRLIDENDLYTEYENSYPDNEITFKQFIGNCCNGNGFLEHYKIPEFYGLRVCEHCLQAIESHEGKQRKRKIYVEDINGVDSYCTWCDSLHNDIIYEI